MVVICRSEIFCLFCFHTLGETFWFICKEVQFGCYAFFHWGNAKHSPTTNLCGAPMTRDFQRGRFWFTVTRLLYLVWHECKFWIVFLLGTSCLVFVLTNQLCGYIQKPFWNQNIWRLIHWLHLILTSSPAVRSKAVAKSWSKRLQIQHVG